MKWNTVSVITLLSLTLSPFLAAAAIPDELRKALEEKAKASLEISNQIQSTQKQLNTTQAQKNTLQNAIKKIDYSINQLNLGIRSSQINIEKLGLELDALQYEINDINAEIGIKKFAVIKLIRHLYEKDREGLLATLLKNRSLADGFLEGQSIVDLNSGLSVELQNLKTLNGQLDVKFQSTNGKKQNIETENGNLRARRSIVTDQKSERQNLLAQTKNQEKTFASLIDTLAKRQAEISAELEAIEKELRSKIDPSLLPVPRPGVLARPVDGVMTQEYGHTAFARNGYRGKFHNGVDIGAPVGTEVRSSESGTVIAIGNQDQFCSRGAYGKFIAVEHENNLTTLYAHLSGQTVQKGDKVIKGQVIGYVGRTGYATGAHLHFTAYAGPTFYIGASRVCGPMPFGGDMDPLQYLAL